MQRIQEFQRQLSTELRELGALTEEMGSSLSERMHDLEMKEVDIRALQQETAEVPPVPHGSQGEIAQGRPISSQELISSQGVVPGYPYTTTRKPYRDNTCTSSDRIELK